MGLFYELIAAHVGHDLECVQYGDGENVAIECTTCNQVIVNADRNEENES